MSQKTPMINRLDAVNNRNVADDLLELIEVKILEGYKLGVSDSIQIARNELTCIDIDEDIEIELIDREALIMELERLL